MKGIQTHKWIFLGVLFLMLALSNNHSDAWFVGVSPKLICGAFFESVLSDKRFRKYRGKFAPPHDADLRSFMYDCSGSLSIPKDSTELEGVDEGISIGDMPNENLEAPADPSGGQQPEIVVNEDAE